MIALHPLTRDRAIVADPRIAHVDAMIRIRGDDHLDLWSHHSHQSRELPTDHHPLVWIEDSCSRGVGIGMSDEMHVNVYWRFDVVDGRVLCSYEVTVDGPEADEWARQFSRQWSCPRYDVSREARLLDLALQNHFMPAVALAGYTQADEALRAESRRKMDEQIAEYKRKRASRPPPLASAEQVVAGIPPIADDELERRAAKLRPLVMKHEYETVLNDIGGPCGFRERCLGLHYIGKPSDLRGQSFTWSEDIREKTEGLAAAKTVITLHTFGYHGMFKPSIAEVLAQAPDDWAEYVAFSVAGPEDADDLGRDQAALDAGFHAATTTYYRRGK